MISARTLTDRQGTPTPPCPAHRHLGCHRCRCVHLDWRASDWGGAAWPTHRCFHLGVRRLGESQRAPDLTGTELIRSASPTVSSRWLPSCPCPEASSTTVDDSWTRARGPLSDGAWLDRVARYRADKQELRDSRHCLCVFRVDRVQRACVVLGARPQPGHLHLCRTRRAWSRQRYQRQAVR